MPSATSTSLSRISGPNPSVFGQQVTLQASVTPNTGSPKPTGNVQIKDGGSVIATFPLDSSCHATGVVSSLAVGTHSNLTAVYLGDSNFSGSTSSAISQTVSPANTAVSITPSPTPSTYGVNSI